MKRNTKKGFTLAELLIVVGIIAILAAIVVPVFGTQLDKVRAAAELANVRAKYAEMLADEMLNTQNYTREDAGTIGITISTSELKEALQYKGSSIQCANSANDEDHGRITVRYKGIESFFETDGDVLFDKIEELKNE